MVKIIARVVSQEGSCGACQKVGDEVVFDWDNNEVRGKICLHALYSLMPKVFAMAMSGNVAFVKAEDGTRVARHPCPDAYNPVVYELRRI